MADITASMVKDLRDRTGRGYDGLQEGAERDERRHGNRSRLAAHQRPRVGREEGRTDSGRGLGRRHVSGTRGTVVEVNSETDFVAKNDQFQGFVRTVTGMASTHGDGRRGAARRAVPRSATAMSVRDVLTHNIATIGENQSLRRAQDRRGQRGHRRHLCPQCSGQRSRQDRRARRLESKASPDVLEPLGRQIAMHIAAANPLALDVTASTRRSSSANVRLRARRRPDRASQPISSRR